MKTEIGEQLDQKLYDETVPLSVQLFWRTTGSSWHIRSPRSSSVTSGWAASTCGKIQASKSLSVNCSALNLKGVLIEVYLTCSFFRCPQQLVLVKRYRYVTAHFFIFLNISLSTGKNLCEVRVPILIFFSDWIWKAFWTYSKSFLNFSLFTRGSDYGTCFSGNRTLRLFFYYKYREAHLPTNVPHLPIFCYFEKGIGLVFRASVPPEYPEAGVQDEGGAGAHAPDRGGVHPWHGIISILIN